MLDTDGSDFEWDTDSESEEESGNEGGPQSDNSDFGEEMEGKELTQSLAQSLQHEMDLLKEVNSYGKLMEPCTTGDWKKAESNCGFGYTGNSKQSQDRARKKARDRPTRMRNYGRHECIQPSIPSLAPPSTPTLSPATEIFTGYASNVSKDVPMPEDEPDVTEDEGRGEMRTSNAVNNGINDAINNLRSPQQHHIRPPPPLKHCCLDKAKEERWKVLEVALQDIEHIIGSKQTKFVVGREGLQAQQARAIEYYLYMVVKNQQKGIDVSERAAEVMKLSPSWGGRLVRRWVCQWIAGHAKMFLLLEEPAIRTELRSYIQSNKWVINPAKLVDFSQKKMIPAVADKYLRKLVEGEMPQVQLKVEKGVSLKTARQFLRNEGSNDGKKKGWVFEDKQPLKKKGAGCGLHQSDMVCSTFGWIEDASQTLEYGKNYKGYWTGELFVKQPLNSSHGPGYQALIMVNNSQGHSAYAKDALLVSRMNLRPGGKQACMRAGWFICDGKKITQSMIFPLDHPNFPDQAKRNQATTKCYLCKNCDYTFATLQEICQKR
ncbi:hypothetical protein B0H34DRAFT_783079 [Crassisporium funariophilum]|nr:hypothetical protein B0H34DRAFT_783079 [Crassisporium funariophilum]